jgi:hypothetical protein
MVACFCPLRNVYRPGKKGFFLHLSACANRQGAGQTLTSLVNRRLNLVKNAFWDSKIKIHAHWRWNVFVFLSAERRRAKGGCMQPSVGRFPFAERGIARSLSLRRVMLYEGQSSFDFSCKRSHLRVRATWVKTQISADFLAEIGKVSRTTDEAWH